MFIFLNSIDFVKLAFYIEFEKLKNAKGRVCSVLYFPHRS